MGLSKRLETPRKRLGMSETLYMFEDVPCLKLAETHTWVLSSFHFSDLIF